MNNKCTIKILINNKRKYKLFFFFVFLIFSYPVFSQNYIGIEIGINQNSFGGTFSDVINAKEHKNFCIGSKFDIKLRRYVSYQFGLNYTHKKGILRSENSVENLIHITDLQIPLGLKFNLLNSLFYTILGAHISYTVSGTNINKNIKLDVRNDFTGFNYGYYYGFGLHKLYPAVSIYLELLYVKDLRNISKNFQTPNNSKTIELLLGIQFKLYRFKNQSY